MASCQSYCRAAAGGGPVGSIIVTAALRPSAAAALPALHCQPHDMAPAALQRATRLLTPQLTPPPEEPAAVGLAPVPLRTQLQPAENWQAGRPASALLPAAGLLVAQDGQTVGSMAAARANMPASEPPAG